MTQDATLRMQIEEALNHDERVDADAIAVESKFGIVTISGYAASDCAALAAVEIVASFRKCHGVANRQVLREPLGASCEFLHRVSRRE